MISLHVVAEQERYLHLYKQDMVALEQFTQVLTGDPDLSKVIVFLSLVEYHYLKAPNNQSDVTGELKLLIQQRCRALDLVKSKQVSAGKVVPVCRKKNDARL